MDILSSIDIESILQSTIRLAAPFILAAIGGLFSDSVGVSSIELEALVLMGAFAGFVGTYFSGSLWIGLVVAMLSGVFLTAIYGGLVVGLGCRGPLVAMALVLFSTGFTNFYNRVLFGITTDVVRVENFAAVRIPVLGDIPVIGDIFFNQNVLVYISFALVIVSWFFYKKLPIGLEWRAVGENPYAADTVGIPVRKYRYIGVLLTGIIVSLAGAYLSIASSNVFVEKMSAEKGYAAFAIIILGKYTPVGAFLGCLLYGFADALQLNLQAMGIDMPNQFLLMLPYIFTLVVLFTSGKGKAPQGHGKFFKKGMQI